MYDSRPCLSDLYRGWSKFLASIRNSDSAHNGVDLKAANEAPELRFQYAERLRAIRKRLKLTQEEAGKIIGEIASADNSEIPKIAWVSFTSSLEERFSRPRRL